MASISSRTMASTRRSTFRPSGSQVYMPGLTRRMYPARTSSWWLGTSASAGFSRRVRRNRDDMRMATGELLGWMDNPPRITTWRDAAHAPFGSGRRRRGELGVAGPEAVVLEAEPEVEIVRGVVDVHREPGLVAARLDQCPQRPGHEVRPQAPAAPRGHHPDLVDPVLGDRHQPHRVPVRVEGHPGHLCPEAVVLGHLLDPFVARGVREARAIGEGLPVRREVQPGGLVVP